MNSKSLLTLVFLLTFIQVKSQTPNWDWARSAVSKDSGASEGIGISIDSRSNVYISGFFLRTTNFGPYTLTGGNASLSGFIVKYDSLGNILWAKGDSGVKTTSVCYGYFVSTDNSGNSYFSGYFNDSIYFDSHILISNGGLDIFIVKFDSLGKVCWARNAGGTGGEQGLGVKADAFGNVYITGFFNSSIVNFGASVLTNAGSSDIILAKYDSSGNELWAVSGGSTATDDAFGITTDAQGNVYLTGYYNSPFVAFGLDTVFNSGDYDFFLAKYDSSGKIIWGKGAIGSGFDKPTSIATDSHGNIYVTGFFNSPSISFDSVLLINSSGANTFLVKYNSYGNVLWAKHISGSSSHGYCVTTDAAAKVFVTGYFGDSTTIFFDTLALQSKFGSVDPMYIACYDSSGNSIFAKALSSGGDDWSAITVGSTGSVYVGGDFYKVSPFIVGNDSLILTGEETAFIAKLRYTSTEDISEIKTDEESILYPNPFNEKLNILAKENCPTEIILYDILSRKLLHQKFINSTILNTNQLSSGIYIFEVRSDKGIINKGKVIKQ